MRRGECLSPLLINRQSRSCLLSLPSGHSDCLVSSAVCCDAFRPHEGGVCACNSSVTLSAPASDDEGSTAATDGSTLRTSPADHGGSVGSESGGSAVDSVAGEHSGNVPGCLHLFGLRVVDKVEIPAWSWDWFLQRAVVRTLCSLVEFI